MRVLNHREVEQVKELADSIKDDVDRLSDLMDGVDPKDFLYGFTTVPNPPVCTEDHFKPSPGHWYVGDTIHGTQWTNVGEIKDLETAKIRVALQRAGNDAAKAIVELQDRAGRNGLAAVAYVDAIFTVIADHYSKLEE